MWRRGVVDVQVLLLDARSPLFVAACLSHLSSGGGLFRQRGDGSAHETPEGSQYGCRPVSLCRRCTSFLFSQSRLSSYVASSGVSMQTQKVEVRNACDRGCFPFSVVLLHKLMGQKPDGLEERALEVGGHGGWP